MFIQSTYLREEKGIRVFIGIFIALFFPFTARGIMDTAKIPFLSAFIYWFFCGIILRLIMGKKLPYFKPKFKKVWIETLILFIATFAASYFYIKGSGIKIFNINFTKDTLINIFAFSILNGCFEQLVWINIYELAGSVYKWIGFIFSIIFVSLIHILFWSRIIPSPAFNDYIFLSLQGILFIIPFIIYNKTKDLTIWSLQHMLYNIIAVLYGNFGISVFMNIK